MRNSYVYSILMMTTFWVVGISAAQAASPSKTILNGLAPHRAIYDIDLIATHSGSQILNISGQMSYELKSTCDAWTTDHHFKLFYEYADAPGMRIVSDFTTFEDQKGDRFEFSSRRQRNGKMYQEIRGSANIDEKKGAALYAMPESVRYDLSKGTLFPIGHTVELIQQAEKGTKFFNAQVFDGSDEDGPIEINAFVGKEMAAPPSVLKNNKIEVGLLKDKAWNVRMAVFPTKDREEESDYEMTMVFHKNGIISDMTIDYDDFSVRQSLIALEKIPAENCDDMPEVPKKP